jgi:hypothetical protein
MRNDLVHRLRYKFTYTVEPLITRLIGLRGNLAIEIPRYRMHYGYVKSVMRMQQKSTRCLANPPDHKLVIR